MPEPTSQAAQPEPVTPEGAQVPEFTPTQGGTQPQEPQKETPLTTEQIAAIEKIADQRATRIAQSQVAKGETRIQRLIQDKFTALETTRGTLGLSEEQVAQAKQKIVTEAYSSTEEPPTAQAAPPASPDTDEAIQFMNAQIANVFDEVGTSITKSDPEFAELQKVIDASWSDPKGLTKILRAADKAATTKAARLQSQQQTAAARVTTGGQPGGQATQQPKSAHSAWENAYNKQ
jgi:hypothetical protein